MEKVARKFPEEVDGWGLQCPHLCCTVLVLKAMLGRVHQLQALLYTLLAVGYVRQVCACCCLLPHCSASPSWLCTFCGPCLAARSHRSLADSVTQSLAQVRSSDRRGALSLEIVQSFPFCFSVTLVEALLSNPSSLPAMGDSLTAMQFPTTTLLCVYILFHPACLLSLSHR